MAEISDLRKLDGEVSWLVFGETPDESFQNVMSARPSMGFGAGKPLPHYTNDGAAAARIITHIQENGGSITFSESGKANFPITCKLALGQGYTNKDWSDAEANSTTKELALCIAVLRAAGRVMEMHGAKFVSLDWVSSQATPAGQGRPKADAPNAEDLGLGDQGQSGG